MLKTDLSLYLTFDQKYSQYGYFVKNNWRDYLAIGVGNEGWIMSDKIKVLHLLQSDKFSGAENVACKIIEMFNDDTNFEMAYCSKSGQISDVLQKKGIMYYPMSNLSIREVKRVVDLFEPDIIHAHDASASVISSMLSKRYPILSHMHSNPPWIKKMGKNSILYFISSLRFRNVLTVSSSIMEEYVFGRFLTKNNN